MTQENSNIKARYIACQKRNTEAVSTSLSTCDFKSVKDQAIALNDYQLLEKFLTASARLQSKERAFAIIDHYGSISAMVNAQPQELKKKFGISKSVITRIFCALEFGRRILTASPKRGDVLDRPQVVKDYYQYSLANKKREEFLVLYLDNRSRLIQAETLFIGTIDNAVIHPREVLRRCFELCAAAIIVGHNHPSGNSKPSDADQRITKKLQAILKSVNISFIDHIVVGAGNTTSFAEEGII